jgi:hypothetical protein
MTRGRCGSLLLHRSGLSPPTSCRCNRRTLSLARFHRRQLGRLLLHPQQLTTAVRNVGPTLMPRRWPSPSPARPSPARRRPGTALSQPAVMRATSESSAMILWAASKSSTALPRLSDVAATAIGFASGNDPVAPGPFAAPSGPFIVGAELLAGRPDRRSFPTLTLRLDVMCIDDLGQGNGREQLGVVGGPPDLRLAFRRGGAQPEGSREPQSLFRVRTILSASHRYRRCSINCCVATHDAVLTACLR